MAKVAWRDCPKSPVHACGVALGDIEKVHFGPTGPLSTGYLHGRSGAYTPFRTVSEEEFCELRQVTPESSPSERAEYPFCPCG